MIAVITARPAKRRSVSDSDVIVTGSAFILPLELVIFACFATIGQSVDWREPIGLQERLEEGFPNSPLSGNRGYISNRSVLIIFYLPNCQIILLVLSKIHLI